MPSFAEMNQKVSVSVGLILALIFATFLVTSFYLEMTTLEERVDKRYERESKKNDEQDDRIKKIEDEIHSKKSSN